MIAPWLVYAIGLSAALGAVAMLLERVARWGKRPTRWVWLTAIVLMIALPMLLALRTPVAADRHPVPRHAAVPANRQSPSLDLPLGVLWMLASLGLGARVLLAAVVLRRRRKCWEAMDVDGEQVLVANEAGPAVIGWGKLTTVIPRWAMRLDSSSRALMLQHESEHARSGDPYLRTLGTVALVVTPWNPALWWATRRLHLAIEIDCDRRLLDHGVDPHHYATLLVAVGERMSRQPFAWTTAFASPRSSLESRIRAMTLPFRPRRPRLAMLAVVAVISAIVVIACAAPAPAGVLPGAGAREPSRLKEMAYSGPGRPNELVPDTLISACEEHSVCPGGPGPDTIVEFRRRPAKDTVYLNFQVIGPHDSLEEECEMHSYCNGFVAQGRRNDTTLVFLDDSTFSRRSLLPGKRP